MTRTSQQVWLLNEERLLEDEPIQLLEVIPMGEDAEAAEERRQALFKLEKPVDYGVDEDGEEYQIIPLSMLKGGKLKPTKVMRGPVKHIQTSSHPAPRGWYKNKTYDPPTKRPRPCYTEAMLTTPYAGYCPVGCSFCYVTNGNRGYRATGIATASSDYPEYMAKSIAKMNFATSGYLTSFTEPFQHLEAKYGVSERLANVYADAGLPIFFLTRLYPPDWAYDVLLRNPYSYMQFSINTPNEKHRRRMAPGGSPVERQLDAISRMNEKGIYVSIQCNPVMAGITTLEELLELVDLLNQAGTDHIIFKFVEQVYSNRNLILDRLRGNRVPGVDKLDALLTQKTGGVWTIAQEVRVAWLTELLKKTRSVGMTMSTCYEYYDDGTQGGASLAWWFTTSDQCHGPGVPVFYRPEPGQKFVPLPGCYRKGCLNCEEHGTQACRNETLLQANALQFKDYKNIKLEGREEDWNMEDSCVRPELTRDYGVTYANPNLMTDAELWGLPKPW